MALLERRSGVVEGYRRTAPPAPSLPWRQASFAVLGLEATGPDPRRDQLLSVACVPVERGKAIMAKAFEATIRPGGLALEPIVQALTGRVLVAHAAQVHVGFLTAALREAGIDLKGPTLDTSALAAWVPRRGAQEADPSPAMRNSPGLSVAASSMGLPVHRPHQASGAALTTAQLFMALASCLDLVHPQTVGSLARPSSVTSALDVPPSKLLQGRGVAKDLSR